MRKNDILQEDVADEPLSITSNSPSLNTRLTVPGRIVVVDRQEQEVASVNRKTLEKEYQCGSE
jgi:hypothetical protein